MRYRSLTLALGLAIASCGDAPGGGDSIRQALTAGASAAGSIPAGLPARLMVGLFEDSGATWMKNSGVRWDARYRYFTKGWVNNWGWSAYDGSWGLAYLRECDAQGYVPAVQYYQLVGEPGGGEEKDLAKVQNASLMKSYFGDFKILMQRVKEFGKPALILLEADAFAFLQRQSGDNPNAYAAVAASGMPELAGLPNTVAGWGLAFLQLRKAVGASNAILGIHVSAWATGKDIAHFSVTDPLGPEVDKAYAFLAPFGLDANVTGATYDVLVGDPLDRDANYYRLSQGQDRWWDPSDAAPIASKSFNRYAEWLRLWNAKAKKRWVLWQIPLGNSHHLDVPNGGKPREGYKDNRTEYFFGNGTAHLVKFADVGTIALLFGAGAQGQSSYQNDTYSDGKLFMQSRAGAILNAGGVALATGSSGTGGSGGSGGTAGTGGSGGTGGTGGTTTSDGAQYGFESGTQGWASSGGMITGVASSGVRAYAGARSLEVNVAATAAGKQRVFVRNPPTPAGATVTFRIWFPAGSALSSMQPYVQQGSAGGWAWTGAWRSTSSLAAGTWNGINVTVPSGAATPLWELGVELATSGPWTGKVYVDSVRW